MHRCQVTRTRRSLRYPPTQTPANFKSTQASHVFFPSGFDPSDARVLVRRDAASPSVSMLLIDAPGIVYGRYVASLWSEYFRAQYQMPITLTLYQVLNMIFYIFVEVASTHVRVEMHFLRGKERTKSRFLSRWHVSNIGMPFSVRLVLLVGVLCALWPVFSMVVGYSQKVLQ